MFEIEKGVPLPDVSTSTRRNSKFAETLRTIEIGDSFFVPYAGYKNRAAAHNAVYCSSSRIKDKKFTTHRTEDGVRVWRVE